MQRHPPVKESSGGWRWFNGSAGSAAREARSAPSRPHGQFARPHLLTPHPGTQAREEPQRPHGSPGARGAAGRNSLCHSSDSQLLPSPRRGARGSPVARVRPPRSDGHRRRGEPKGGIVSPAPTVTSRGPPRHNLSALPEPGSGGKRRHTAPCALNLPPSAGRGSVAPSRGRRDTA